jgi:hypothetical protein
LLVDANVQFHNSIVSNNTVTITFLTTTTENNDCSEIMGSLGDNLDSDGDCFDTDDDFHGDPGLGPLQNNGGPTMTHAITNTSLAFNNDPCVVSTDQRGVLRPQFGRCDIGAFELEDVVFTPGGGVGPGTTGSAIGDASTPVAAIDPVTGLPASGPSGPVTLFTIGSLSGLYYLGRRRRRA